MGQAETKSGCTDVAAGPGAERPAFRFRLLAEIGNFIGLRRYVGYARAELLADDLAERLSAAVPGARVRVVGRNLVEIDAEGNRLTEIDTISTRMRDACDTPFDLDGELHSIRLVLGASSGAADADDVRLAEDAEQALTDARHAAEAVPATEDPNGLASELERALVQNEFTLFYQPKVHARRQDITSIEALIRWEHPERGLVLPGDFIPAAEATNFIDRLTLWTIERAIADQRILRDAGYDLRIFVNISGRLLSDAGFVERACRLVGATDASLGFEVTETSVIRDPQSAIANLQRFADIGIRIAIDDYGAGLSSLAYLKQLPARELKIDKLFVTQLTSSNRDPLIVRSTIDLAHALDMEVVAEGVETHAALALLTVMGCDMMQGFLISRPIALDALIGFLREDRHRRMSQDSRVSFTRLASSWKRA